MLLQVFINKHKIENIIIISITCKNYHTDIIQKRNRAKKDSFSVKTVKLRLRVSDGGWKEIPPFWGTD